MMMMSAVDEGAQQQREDQSHCIQVVGIGEQAASSSRRELLLDLLFRRYRRYGGGRRRVRAP